jgi:PAS domain S-box-containing protein
MVSEMVNGKFRSKQSSKDIIKKPQRWVRHIFEQSPALVCVTDFDGIFLDINETGAKLIGGVSKEQFIGKISIRNFYDKPEDRKQLQRIIDLKGFVQEFETRFKCMDEKLIDVSITASARRNLKGEVVGYEGFITDITSRKLAEQALKDSEEKYRNVVESSLSAILVHQAGRFQFANQRCAEMFGFDNPEELIGRNFWEYVHPEDQAVVKERGLMREKGQLTPEHYNFRIMERNGKTRWAEMRATHGTYMGRPAAVANFIDITTSKKAEEEIRHLSERLAKVREEERKILAADLHDEVGEILTSMHFDLDALQRAIPSQYSEQKQRCDKLVCDVEKLADIVRKTTAYLRPEILDQMILIPALERHINEFQNICPHIKIIFRTLGLKRRLNPEVELVLYRIFQESLTNIAKHANATSVEIMLTYSHPHVILTIRDNGVGYEETRVNKKAKRNTYGIGLLNMKERAASLGGSFEVSSLPGKGTSIRAKIPV